MEHYSLLDDRLDAEPGPGSIKKVVSEKGFK